LTISHTASAAYAGASGIANCGLRRISPESAEGDAGDLAHCAEQSERGQHARDHPEAVEEAVEQENPAADNQQERVVRPLSQCAECD